MIVFKIEVSKFELEEVETLSVMKKMGVSDALNDEVGERF